MRSVIALLVLLASCSTGTESAAPTTSLAIPTTTTTTATTTTTTTTVAPTTTIPGPSFEAAEGFTAHRVPDSALTIAIPDSFFVVDVSAEDFAAGLEGVELTPEAESAVGTLLESGLEADFYAFDFDNGSVDFVPNVNVLIQGGAGGVTPDLFAQITVDTYETLGATVLRSEIADIELPAVFVEALLPLTETSVSHLYQLAVLDGNTGYFITYSALDPVDPAYEEIILAALYQVEIDGE